MEKPRHRCGILAAAVAAAVSMFVVLGTVTPSRAALTTESCLVQKSKAWSKLRQCERSEDAKAILGRPADRAKCKTRFTTTVARIKATASAAGIACRYRDNLDNTVTDFDTGLMWVKLVALNGNQSADILDADNLYSWPRALEVTGMLNGMSSNSEFLDSVPGNGKYTDWRLPNVTELVAIVDVAPSGCGSGAPCIDPTFRPTDALSYWSSTTRSTVQHFAFLVDFGIPSVDDRSKGDVAHIRPVRAGL